MKKHYRNATPQKPKPPTKAQRHRAWEQTVIAGGMVRASAFPRTAAILNRGRGAVIRVIGVPLVDDRHMKVLQDIADEGLWGQTAEEVAAHFIREGVLARVLPPKCKCCGRM